MKPNPLPAATHSFNDEEVDLATVRPLAVELLQSYRVQRGQLQAVSFPTGAHGSVVVPMRAPDVVTGPDGEHQVFWNGDERACTCGAENCLHVNAVAALELAAAD